jgi:hypothetical protein
MADRFVLLLERKSGAKAKRNRVRGRAELNRLRRQAVIKIERTDKGDPLEFGVIVRVGRGETHHHVTMAEVEASCRLRLDNRGPASGLS